MRIQAGEPELLSLVTLATYYHYLLLTTHFLPSLLPHLRRRCRLRPAVGASDGGDGSVGGEGAGVVGVDGIVHRLHLAIQPGRGGDDAAVGVGDAADDVVDAVDAIGAQLVTAHIEGGADGGGKRVEVAEDAADVRLPLRAITASLAGRGHFGAE